MMPVLVPSVLLLIAVSGPTQNAGSPLEQRFNRLDRNADGALSADELTTPALFNRLDADRGGSVTLDEVRAGWRQR